MRAPVCPVQREVIDGLHRAVVASLLLCFPGRTHMTRLIRCGAPVVGVLASTGRTQDTSS